MSLNWKPELKKFAFKAADGEWQTRCSFEGTPTDGAASRTPSPPSTPWSAVADQTLCDPHFPPPDHMWHHAVVSIGEDGKGSLIVDGAVQELEFPNGG